MDERSQVFGRLIEVPGRGQVMAPPIAVDEHTTERASGQLRVRALLPRRERRDPRRRDSAGVRRADGQACHTGRSPSRTAYLHVNYRSITPIEKKVGIEAYFDSEQGRKRILRGVIRDGDTVCAEAEGLFVALRPGQP